MRTVACSAVGALFKKEMHEDHCNEQPAGEREGRVGGLLTSKECMFKLCKM